MTASDLRTGALARLAEPDGPYARVEVVDSTGSTNADLIAAARGDAPDRTVLVAGAQTAGRGRRSRTWVSPPDSGVYFSVLLRPDGVPAPRLGTLSLVAGLALVRAVREVAGVRALLKWPNDLLGPSGGKFAGILAEVEAGPRTAVVVGIGLNVAPLSAPAGPGGLPATSLADESATTTDRAEIVAAVLTRFDELERRWRQAHGALGEVLDGYREVCATLGRRVRVELAGDQAFEGTAVDVDALGALEVTADDGTRRTVSAGDVIHLRNLG
jgi:BirA family biotin operon repressor/biotin-[acetyl-CoA-carboxylase] ligase